MFQKRNIALYVVLSIVTCGLYSIYWVYCIASDLNNREFSEAPTMSAGATAALHIFCSIYTLYCYFKWGKTVQQVYAMGGQYKEDRSVLYLILGFFSYGIISMALIQNDLNNAPPPSYNPNPGMPYGQPQQPYSAPGQSYTYAPQQPYGAPQQPYGQPQQPYGQQPAPSQTYTYTPPQADGQPQQPYGMPEQPSGQEQQPNGQPQQPYQP